MKMGYQQMKRDGIKKLSAWGKPRREGCATIRDLIALPHCTASGCGKKAGYSTPFGPRCFGHAIPDQTNEVTHD